MALAPYVLVWAIVLSFQVQVAFDTAREITVLAATQDPAVPEDEMSKNDRRRLNRLQKATQHQIAIVCHVKQSPTSDGGIFATGFSKRLTSIALAGLGPHDFLATKVDCPNSEASVVGFGHLVFEQTLMATLNNSVIQGILVFAFPLMFATAALRSARALDEPPEEQATMSRVAKFKRAMFGAKSANGVHRPHVLSIMRRRHQKFLEDSSRIDGAGSRAALAFLLVIGTTYMLSPLGMRTSIAGEYVVFQMMPVGRTIPFWAVHFTEAPPVVFGFAGFLLYALAGYLERLLSGSISNRMVLPLVLRGVTVVVLGLALDGVYEAQQANARALAFIVGVFPQTGLQLLGKVAESAGAAVSDDSNSRFRFLPQIDLWKEMALKEVGITNLSELVHTDLAQLVTDVGIHPALLIEVVDQAVLLDALGPERHAKLDAALGIRRSTQLLTWMSGGDDGRQEQLAQALEMETVEPVLAAARQNPNVRYILDDLYTLDAT